MVNINPDIAIAKPAKNPISVHVHNAHLTPLLNSSAISEKQIKMFRKHIIFFTPYLSYNLSETFLGGASRPPFPYPKYAPGNG